MLINGTHMMQPSLALALALTGSSYHQLILVDTSLYKLGVGN